MDATLFLADLEAKPASLRALADALAHGNPWREQVTLQPPVLLLGMGYPRASPRPRSPAASEPTAFR